VKRGPHSDQNNKAFALLRRETLILIALAAAAVPLFFFTRAMAAWNRETGIASGHVWFARARNAHDQGGSDPELDYLRKAIAADRNNMEYSISLAESLDIAGQPDEARQILLRLRDSRPEDGRINLDLARLSVKADEADAARMYYHQALYGMWPAGRQDAVSAGIRIELVRFLLSRHDASSAVSELLILDANSPPDATAKTELGALLLQADEPGRALNQFLGALKLQPANPAALAGAGEAQFKMGNDEAAHRQLQIAAQHGPLSLDAQSALELSGLVLSTDPMANGIGGHERARRLTLALGLAADRLDACSHQGALADPAAAEAMRSELARVRQQISTDSSRADLNLLSDGLKIASTAERAGTTACGPLSASDQAIVLAAERHKVNAP
jgi:Flp pilus assembly protein TadD